MTTHQADFQRMAMMTYLIGKYNIENFVECGVHEGETVGYFSQFVKYAGGCDLNDGGLQIAKQRYPKCDFTKADALEYLESLDNTNQGGFFYLDCTWPPVCRPKEMLAIIKKRWPNAVVMVNGFYSPDRLYGLGEALVSELRYYGRLIVPKYSIAPDQIGYAFILPEGKTLNLPFRNWEII